MLLSQCLMIKLFNSVQIIYNNNNKYNKNGVYPRKVRENVIILKEYKQFQKLRNKTDKNKYTLIYY